MIPEVSGGGEGYAEGQVRLVQRTSGSTRYVAAARVGPAKLMPSLYLSGLPARKAVGMPLTPVRRWLSQEADLGRRLRWSWRHVGLVG